MKIKRFPSLVLFGLFYMSVVMAGYEETIRDIQKTTDGKGVFQVTIHNRGKMDIDGLSVLVELSNPPKGYDDTGIVFSTIVAVKAGSYNQVLCPKPLLVKKYSDYLGDGPKLPIDSKVEVYVQLGGAVQCKTYPASYINETKIIDVPDNVEFDVDFG